MDEKQPKPHINVDYFEDLTGDIGPQPSAVTDDIGNRICSLRKNKGLSLKELSSLTGFEVELMAGIENNTIQPQLGTVIKLSKALDSAFGRLVSGVGEKIYSITRKTEQRPVARSTAQKGQ